MKSCDSVEFKTENALIGCMLLDYRYVFRRLPLHISQDFFKLKENQNIFNYLSNLYYNEQDKDIDFVELVKAGCKYARLGELMNETSLLDMYYNFESMAEIWIHEASKTDINNKINELKINESENYYDELLKLKETLDDIEDFKNSSMLPPTDEQICNKLKENYAKDDKTRIYKTKIACLDNVYQIRKQELTVIGASTSIGKSALGVKLAVEMAKDNAIVYYVSTEMGEEDQAIRLMAKKAGLNSYWIRDKTLKAEELEIFKQTKGYTNLYMDCLTRKPRDIEKRIILTRPDVIIVDHLHDFFYDKKLKRDEGVSENVRAIKNYAMKYNIAAIVTVQLNREAETAEELNLSMIGQSSAIEQVADGVMFLKRNREKDTKTMQIIMAKNRHGELCPPLDVAINLPTFDFY